MHVRHCQFPAMLWSFLRFPLFPLFSRFTLLLACLLFDSCSPSSPSTLFLLFLMRMFPLSLGACCRQQVGGHKQVRQVVKPLSLRRAETERETERWRERERWEGGKQEQRTASDACANCGRVAAAAVAAFCVTCANNFWFFCLSLLLPFFPSCHLFLFFLCLVCELSLTVSLSSCFFRLLRLLCAWLSL